VRTRHHGALVAQRERTAFVGRASRHGGQSGVRRKGLEPLRVAALVDLREHASGPELGLQRIGGG
jgi:hypothetical protein